MIRRASPSAMHQCAPARRVHARLARRADARAQFKEWFCMFRLNVKSGSDSKDVLDALGRSLAIIEFEPSGRILWANDNFCKAMGYDLAEIKGQHHSMFVQPEFARSPDYKAFWTKLGRGEFDAAEYKRLGKGGREVWIQASYNPVVDAKGVVKKVVKVATDITA